MSIFLSTLQRMTTSLLFLLCLIAFLVGTTSGLHTTLWLIKPYLPKTMVINGLNGRLYDRLSLQSLEYQGKDYIVKLRDAEFSWSMLSFLRTHQINAELSWQQLNFTPDKNTSIQTQGHWRFNHSKTTLDARIQRDKLNTTLHLDGQLNDQGLQAQGHWILNEYLKSTIVLNLPAFKLIRSYAKQKIDAQLIFDSIDLSPFSPASTQLKGRLDTQLMITGLLNQPEYAGKMTIVQGSFDAPEKNIHISSFDMQLTSQNHHWDYIGHLYPIHTDGKIDIQGQGQDSSGEWQIRGNHIEAIYTSNLHLWITPALRLEMKDGIFKLTGHLWVPEAQITPVTFSNSLHLTDDATFVSKEESSSHLPLYVNIDLEMGEKVALQLQEIKGLLSGKLNLQQDPQHALVGQGILTLKEGQYQGHGQSFQLKESKLIFSGETITNPKIHVLATRSIHQNKQTAAAMSRLFNFQSTTLPDIHSTGQLTVGIEMTGRLQDPRVKLFSSPATLSEADILSFLLLGKPASEANQSGISLLMSAINAYHLDDTAQGAKMIQSLQNLKSKLALDIDIQPNQTQQKTSASVGIGKAITERVYIHYAVNPFQENSNVITLTYLLNKFFSIQVSASDIGNGIDLLYTHSEP